MCAVRTPFQKHIQTALDDPILQSALDANAERRLAALDAAFAGLPEGREALRRQAHAMRRGVVENLEALLAQFLQRVQQNGVIVHRAADSAEAVGVVLEIAKQHGAQRVAKAKSMVSEEIHLNAALQQAGLEVVETDLGEYIIQLRGEPPAHIITPAVHLTRAQVGQTFTEQLGIPYTDDIATLTTAARRVLRRVFLEADLGISGVNAGVAETGTLALVTNEGNGRMCTSLPPVHVALMGMERLVPTLDDLALLLKLLPRSATGQNLSVYTNLIHSPRRPGDPDGPLERHLIVVDNGRSRLPGAPLADALMCIRCGACLNACPVFRELGGHAYRGAQGQVSPYPGPIGSVISPGLFGVAAFGHLARASTLCGACKEACPVDIDLPRLLLELRAMGADGKNYRADTHNYRADGKDDQAAPFSERAEMQPAETWPKSAPGVGEGRSGPPQRQANAAPTPPRPLWPGQRAPAAWGLRLFLTLFTWAAISPRRYRLAQKAAGLFSRLAGRRGGLVMPAFTGWGLSRNFPVFAQRPFTEEFALRVAQRDEEADSGFAAAPGEEGSARLPGAAAAPLPAAAAAVVGSPAAGLDRAAAAQAAPHAPPPLAGELDSAAGPSPAPSAVDLNASFAQALTALGGQVVLCRSSDLAEAVMASLRARQVMRLQAWADDCLPPGLGQTLRAAGFEISDRLDPDAPVGLTGALLGIADTGSVLLTGGPGRALTASLVPPVHFCVLPADRLTPDLPSALRHPQVGRASSAVIISGPSRTADIEMTLTIGVHGPGELVVFVMQDD